MAKYCIFIDFDGTITEKDVAVVILEKFADKQWIEIENRAIEGKLTMDEVIIGQYSLIQGPIEEIIKTAKQVPIREGFVEFIEFCYENEIKVTCLSAGISFIIEDIFRELEIEIPIIAPLSTWNEGKVVVSTIPYDKTEFMDFKHQEVKKYQELGFKTIFLGDGYSDVYGITNSDYRFVVEGSSVERYCKKKSLEHETFKTFEDVKEKVKEIL